MTIRTDHVAGAAFVLFGLLIFALSGDLPMGRLSMPASGFMPTLLATLLVVFGMSLMLRAGESQELAALEWSDVKHAVPVVLITAIAIALYTQLGFILTMMLMLLALLVLVERRNPVRAAVYAVVVVLLAYGLFDRLLKAPLPTGPLGF
jgi:putative tricarboxylic transport membrane protein